MARKFFLALVGIGLLLTFTPDLYAKDVLNSKTADQTGVTNFSLLSVGNWRYYLSVNGLSRNPFTFAGGYYPRDKVTALYNDGIIWAGWLKDPHSEKKIARQPLRAGGVWYRAGLQPGYPATFDTTINFEQIEYDKIYRYTNVSNYFLRRLDAAYLLNIPPEEVTDDQIESFFFQDGEDQQHWPVEIGAPFVDKDGNRQYNYDDLPGYAENNQVLWLTLNDFNPARTAYAFGCSPIGLQLDMTIWTYEGEHTPGGQVLFKRYHLKNRSGYLLDSLFIGICFDPDVGHYGNDFVGCDSILNFFYAYNSQFTDEECAKYNIPPPAVGVKVLQGPIVYTGQSTDTALFNHERKVGFKNLSLHAFTYEVPYVESNPPLGDYLTTISTYNLLRGFRPTTSLDDLQPYYAGAGPRAGQPTRFPLHGNPVAGTGDLDGQGSNPKAGDRRMIGSFGPLTMQPGDEQEIIVAIIGGSGSDHIQSLAEVQKMLPFVEAFANGNFQDIPRAPAYPEAKASPLGDKIVLNWGFDQDRVHEVEEQAPAGYRFEGYNVYQLKPVYKQEGFHIGALDYFEKKKIATFDVKNDVGWIESRYFDSNTMHTVFGIVQDGKNSGVKRYLLVDWDYINDCPLYRGNTYYYQITAYNYNPAIREYSTFESGGKTLEVVLQDAKPGNRFLAAPEDTVAYQKHGESDVRCQVTVVDPAELTGHDYEIDFYLDKDTTSDTYGELLWNLWDKTLGTKVLMEQKLYLLDEFDDNDGAFVDGLQVKLGVPDNQFKRIYQYSDSKGPLKEDPWDYWPKKIGNDVWHSLSTFDDGCRFYLSSARNDKWLPLNPRVEYFGHDFEMRFTAEGSLFYWYYDSIQVAGQVPFEFWDVGRGTFEDSTDDVRLIAIGNSGGHTPGVFDYGIPDPAYGYPASDWIFVRYPLNEKGSYQAFVQDVTSGAPNFGWFKNSVEVFGNLIICDFAGNGNLPPTNVVIRFITPNYPDENFKITFTAPGKIENDLELMKKDVEKINVFPNPYYTASSLERSRFEHFVTFNHLPPHAIIRIFTLNGAQVIKLEKNDPSQFFRWDLKNEKGWSVASGLYIVHIDMPELKKQKILKLMVITGEEVLEYY